MYSLVSPCYSDARKSGKKREVENLSPKLGVALQREMFDAVQVRMGPRRGLGAPVRDEFFHHDVDGVRQYPLARLMSSRSTSGGGRGGKTRVVLYLSLIWVAAGGDHSTDRPARFWAALLGLPDPDGAGARVVRSTWSELQARRLVEITPGEHAGAVPTVRLLREDGSGRPYTIPDGRAGETYRRIPEFAWRRLFAEPELTGPGLALYLVAVRTAYRARRLEELTFPTAYFRTEYGLGESTRKSGLRNLTDLGVLVPHRRRMDDFGDSSRRARMRYVYDLLEDYAPVHQARPVQPGRPSPEAGSVRQTTHQQPGATANTWQDFAEDPF